MNYWSHFDITTYSINTGEVSLEWKRANTEPIYESENKSKPLYYRQVSLLSIMSKIWESSIKTTSPALRKGKHENKGQFGYR